MAQQARPRKRLSWWMIVLIAVAGLFGLMVVVSVFGVVAKRATLMGELSDKAFGIEHDAVPSSAPRESPMSPMAEEAEYARQISYDESGAGAIAFGSAAYAAELNRQIIYTADFTIEAEDVDTAADAIESAVKAAGGWVSQKGVEEYTPGERRCSITVRVPMSEFDELCGVFRKQGDVHSDRIETDDVTEEFMDLEARLANLKREEQVVAELFNRQGKIADVLQVERELSRVRGEIERIQGRLKYLKDRVNYSTITATIYARQAEALRKMDKWDLGYHVLRAWRALVNVARTLTYLLIYTVIVAGPFIVLALIVWRVVRAVRRGRPAEPELPPPSEPGQ